MQESFQKTFTGPNSSGQVIKRPLSPHLQIYRPQITSTLSILHRIAGVIVAFGALFFAFMIFILSTSPAFFTLILSLIATKLGMIILFLWTIAFYYHLCDGIRYLIWSFGFLMSKQAIKKSAFCVLGTTILCLIATWGYIFYLISHISGM